MFTLFLFIYIKINKYIYLKMSKIKVNNEENIIIYLDNCINKL